LAGTIEARPMPNNTHDYLDVTILGQAWAEGKEELATSGHLRTADSLYLAMISIGRMRIMIKQKKRLLGLSHE
jgi:hypothetical protein